MIESKKFRDTRTGEIVERFNIMDINYMEEVKDLPVERKNFSCKDTFPVKGQDLERKLSETIRVVCERGYTEGFKDGLHEATNITRMVGENEEKRTRRGRRTGD